MKITAWFLVTASCLVCRLASGSQADDTTITVTGQTAGATPFIGQLTLTASDTTVLKSVQFTIAPKAGSVTRPLSGTYSHDDLVSRGYLQPPNEQFFLPVYGLYDDYTNTVTLTYYFFDGSSKQDIATITTAIFDDPCAYKNPTVLQARTDTTDLSFDYIMIKGRCSSFSPAVIDTDGALRWVGPAGISDISATFFRNAFYIASGTSLYRIELDGTISFLHNYSDIEVTFLHHNIDLGKTGLILDANTTSYFESVNIEVDEAGNVLKTWNLADIISSAMVAGGDDPTQFVYPTPDDWFHNNAVTYNRADDSLIISSRQNFLICLDYESSAIKWILGDTTKKWFQFPSLAQSALALAPGSLAPIGQHAPSIAYDQTLLVFDNGFQSTFQAPFGTHRLYSSPRRYRLDLKARVATEIWNYEMDQSIITPLCASVYEDAPSNYLVDYSFVNGLTTEIPYAQLLGLDATGARIFYYQYGPTNICDVAFNAIPLHLENTKFPAVGPRALNLSTRGLVSAGDNALIGGFIVTGTDSKKVGLRVLGPSLSASGLSNTLADPLLTLIDSSGNVVATNDDWENDPAAAELTADGLAPGDPAESATIQVLASGAYTVVATGQDSSSGIGLVEAYDLSPESSSQLANLSTRGFVGTDDDVLISGLIVGEVASATVAIRALGPSLASDVSGSLDDPMLTIYDTNGAAIASNDNWRDGMNAIDIEKNGLAPIDDAESAIILHPPAGAYTAIVSGVAGATGIGLVEVYDLDP